MGMGIEGTSASLLLDPQSGLIQWEFRAPPGTAGSVLVGGPGDWTVYAQCGTGPEGVCGGSEYVDWFTPESTLEFQIVTVDGQVLAAQAVRAGAVSPAAVSPAISPSVGPSPIGDALSLFDQQWIPGVPNLWLFGGLGGILLLAALRKRK